MIFARFDAQNDQKIDQKSIEIVPFWRLTLRALFFPKKRRFHPFLKYFSRFSNFSKCVSYAQGHTKRTLHKNVIVGGRLQVSRDFWYFCSFSSSKSAQKSIKKRRLIFDQKMEPDFSDFPRFYRFLNHLGSPLPVNVSPKWLTNRTTATSDHNFGDAFYFLVPGRPRDSNVIEFLSFWARFWLISHRFLFYFLMSLYRFFLHG